MKSLRICFGSLVGGAYAVRLTNLCRYGYDCIDPFVAMISLVHHLPGVVAIYQFLEIQVVGSWRAWIVFNYFEASPLYITLEGVNLHRSCNRLKVWINDGNR